MRIPACSVGTHAWGRAYRQQHGACKPHGGAVALTASEHRRVRSSFAAAAQQDVCHCPDTDQPAGCLLAVCCLACSVKPLEEPDDRTKPGAALARPPALTTAGSGALLPLTSPLSTPAGPGIVPPSPKLPGQPVPTPRQQKGDEGPLSPMQVG